jgi:predicted metalloprotease with PDZ domain
VPRGLGWPVLFVLLAVTPAAGPGFATPANPPIRLTVDATEAPRRILHARLEIPVRPGPLTLVYPKWIPGNHAPSGPIADLAGLRLSANGRSLAWERDAVDMYAFHCRVPAGASRLDVTFDRLQSASGNHSTGRSITAQLAVLDWNELLLYPQGRPVAEITFVASLRLPAGWTYGTALVAARADSGGIEFAPVPLATLVDSPVQAGAHRRRIELGPADGPPVSVQLACDSEAGLEAAPAQIAQWKQLAAEAVALFGATHYRRYEFLYTLSDEVDHYGLEHHESSDDRADERALVDDELRGAHSGLLSHEYVHSWNGKYRRPAGLVTSDFQAPARTELLWVYEGLTSYLGWVLTARSGLADPEWQRQVLAGEAARLDRSPGRAWRPLKDTAIAAPIHFGGPGTWSSWRRSTDYYGEGMLIWLEADVLIRERTAGRRSLDDFCRLFFGGVSGPPAVVSYDLDDVVKALGQVAPHDWRGFFEARLDSTSQRAPLGGIEGSGWRLAWSDRLSACERAGERARERTDLRLSLGLELDRDNAITDVVPGSAAAQAGLAPGMKPIAVDGRRFSVERLREALRAGRNGTEPLGLVTEDGDFIRAFRLDWHGGELHPVLVRDAARPDLLAEILKPRTPRIAPEAAEGAVEPGGDVD